MPAELRNKLDKLKVDLENCNRIYRMSMEEISNEDQYANETLNLEQEVKEKCIVCANCGMLNKQINRKCSSWGLNLKKK